MYFDLFQAKVNARLRMRENESSPMLVSFVAVMVVLLAVLLTALLCGEPYWQLAELVQIGYGLDEALLYLLKTQGAGMVFYLFMDRLVTFFAQMVFIGLMAYAMKVARGQQAGLRDLLTAFSRPWKALALVVLTWLVTYLAQLPFSLLSILLTNHGALVPGELISLAGSIVNTFIQLRIALATFCFLDDESCGAVEAIKRSWILVRGDTWKLFYLEISFFGWVIVGVFTLGILYLWLMPYLFCTLFYFYEAMRGGKRVPPTPGSGGESTDPTRSNYAGPSYDDYRPSGPQPF